MRFHIITIFPRAFDSYLKESIVGRAIKGKKITVRFYNPMDFCSPRPGRRGKLKERVDARPYGGGPGMVLRPEPVLKAFSKIKLGKKVKIIFLSTSGKKFTTTYAKNYAKKFSDIVIISGRYEGVDARVQKILKAEEISIGDYVLTGGELPAMILIDCISRQIPGVLGKYESLEEERISSSEVYTRPEILKYTPPGRGKKSKNYRVPKVLLSGNHKKIDEWKTRLTRERK